MNKKEMYIRYFVILAVYAAFAVLLWPFKTALLLASLFAFALTPVLEKLLLRYKKEKLVISLTVFGLLLVLILPLSLVVSSGLYNIAKLQQSGLAQLPVYANTENMITTVWTDLSRFASQYDINLADQVDIKSVLPNVAQFIVPYLTSALTSFPNFMLQLIIFLASLFFFLFKRDIIADFFSQLNLFPSTSHLHLIQLLKRVCYTVVISTLVVASVQAAIIGVAAAISGFNHLIIIFTLAFLLSFMPVIGSIPLTISLAVYCFMQSETGFGILIVGAAILAGTIDNVIRAYILSSDQASVPPLIGILTLIGALSIFGVSGLFLGPIIAELAFSIGRIMNPEIQVETEQIIEG